MSTSNFTNGLHLTQVSFSEIKPGDVGFISPPGAKSNHIGIFAGFDEADGNLASNKADLFGDSSTEERKDE